MSYGNAYSPRPESERDKHSEDTHRGKSIDPWIDKIKGWLYEHNILNRYRSKPVDGHYDRTYGTTYEQHPEEKNPEDTQSPNARYPEKSLVEILCREYGYSREGFDDVELEVKFDVKCRNIETFFNMAEKTRLQRPYMIDKIIPESSSRHSCYGYVKENPELAFTHVKRKDSMKIKIKGECAYENVEDITILKRLEINIEDTTNDKVIELIERLYEKDHTPIAYTGSFDKISKEFFAYNNDNGRIFVVALNVCRSGTRELMQAELEYYGRVNILKGVKTGDLLPEMSALSKMMIGQSVSYGCTLTNNTITKFDWIIEKGK